MEAAAFLHFSSNPLSFLSLPLHAAATLARANRGKPNFVTAVRDALKRSVAEQIQKKNPSAVAFACKALYLKGSGGADALTECLFRVWVAREQWAAALLCLSEAVAAADAAAEAAGKKPAEGGSFREIFRRAVPLPRIRRNRI